MYDIMYVTKFNIQFSICMYQYIIVVWWSKINSSVPNNYIILGVNKVAINN